MTATVTIDNPKSCPRNVHVEEHFLHGGTTQHHTVSPGEKQDFTVYSEKHLMIFESVENIGK